MEDEEKWDGDVKGHPEPTAEQLAEMEMYGEDSDSETTEASTSQATRQEGVSNDDDKEEHDYGEEDAVDDADLWGDEDD